LKIIKFIFLAVVIAIGIIAYLYFADSQPKKVEAATSENTALLAELQQSRYILICF